MYEVGMESTNLTYTQKERKDLQYQKWEIQRKKKELCTVTSGKVQ